MMNLTDKPFEKLARGSYYLILSNISNMTIGAIFWIILAKMVDPSVIGQTMVVIALATSVVGFAGYGVQVTISKYISEYNARNMQSTARKVLKLGLKIGLLVSVIAALCIVLLSGHLASVAYQNPSLSGLIIFAAITYIPSQTIVAALLGAFQGSHRMEYSFVISILYELLRLAIAIMLVIQGLDSFGIIIGFSGASIIASIVGYAYLIPRVIPRSKSNEEAESQNSLRHIVEFSGLNYFAVGMRTLSAQIGVLILGTQNFEWAAFYGLSVMIANIVGGISLAVSRAILPTASEEWAKGNKVKFRSVFNTAIRISLLLSGFAFMIFMIDPGYILRLLSEPYGEASNALRILVVASIINAVGAIIISMLNAANRAHVVARIGLLSSGSTIALTFILAPAIGLEGAAVAILVGSLATLILSVTMLKIKEQVTISTKSAIKPIISISVGLLVGYSAYSLGVNVLVSLTFATISYVGFSLIYRVTTQTELKTLLSIVLRTKRSLDR